jgi:hypothetical protein
VTLNEKISQKFLVSFSCENILIKYVFYLILGIHRTPTTRVGNFPAHRREKEWNINVSSKSYTINSMKEFACLYDKSKKILSYRFVHLPNLKRQQILTNELVRIGFELFMKDF